MFDCVQAILRQRQGSAADIGNRKCCFGRRSTKMNYTCLRTLAGCACIALLGVSLAARADEALSATMEARASGGIHAMIAQKLALSADKPAGVTNEPTYRYKPMYGVIHLGDAQHN